MRAKTRQAAHPGTRADASERLRRLFHILTLVHSRTAGRPLGRDVLASACACSIRTIQRDIDLLRGSGAPLEYDRAARAFVLSDQGWSYPIVVLDGRDALALALARSLLLRPGMPYQAEVTAALDKATAGFPPDLKAVLTAATQVVHSGDLPRDYSRSPLDTLIEAAQAGQTVEIDYQSRRRAERSWRRVDPYAVEQREGGFWELHGWCHSHERVLTFALDRVFAARPTESRFVLRQAEWAAFSGAKGVVGGLRGGAAVAVDVVFAPPVAPYALERRWPDGLQIAPEAEGRARLSGMAQGVSGLVPEILRWRRHAQVLGGPELRAAMTEEVQALAALYPA